MHRSVGLSLLSILFVQPTISFAHMLLAQPPHIGMINNSPLEGPNAVGGGRYPCKYNGDPAFYEGAVRTTMPLGSNYTAKFAGSAVHGGGSCQFSLSKDLAPTAESTFKVIYSIQGGCPARNTPGNLGNNPDMNDPYEYPFTVPSDLEAGQYTFAWTWINKVGNREFYMNCAAVDIISTSEHKGSADYYDTLPDLTVVNIDGVDCISENDNGQGSFKYQNPGEFVETNEALQYIEKQCFAPISKRSITTTAPLHQDESSSPAEAPGDSSDAASDSATGKATATAGLFFTNNAASPSPSLSQNQQQSPQQETSQQTGFSTIVTTNAGPVTPASDSSSPPSPVLPSVITSSQPDEDQANNASNCPPTWLSCTTTGFFCIDKTHFGLCNFGCMPVAQTLAAGVGCDMTTNTLFDLRQG